jgi:hypothetical protein
MTAVFVVGAIAVVGAVMARVTWRRPADERHSIESHQQTLETLRAMADRRPAGRDQPPGPSPDPGPGAALRPPRARTGPLHAGPARTGSTRSSPARAGAVRAPASPGTNGHGHDELLFVDDATAPVAPPGDQPVRVSALALSRGLPRPGRGHRRGSGPRGRSQTRTVAVVAVVAALGVVVGLALAFAPPHHPKAASHRTTTPSKTSIAGTRSATTTTAPPEVQPTSATSSTAAYVAPPTAYTVALQATGPCWVEATEASTGAVVWTGTLASGQSHSIPASGSLFLRLGAADDVTVSLNGEQVLLPAGFQSPFDMRFQST